MGASTTNGKGNKCSQGLPLSPARCQQHQGCLPPACPPARLGMGSLGLGLGQPAGAAACLPAFSLIPRINNQSVLIITNRITPQSQMGSNGPISHCSHTTPQGTITTHHTVITVTPFPLAQYQPLTVRHCITASSRPVSHSVTNLYKVSHCCTSWHHHNHWVCLGLTLGHTGLSQSGQIR